MTTDHSDPNQGCAPVPDTAMATGSEDGDPGDQTMEQLPAQHDGIATVEDSTAAARAVRDDSVLPIDPGDAGDEDDPLTPEFRAPLD
jgi:hypothetical protein